MRLEEVITHAEGSREKFAFLLPKWVMVYILVSPLLRSTNSQTVFEASRITDLKWNYGSTNRIIYFY